MIKETFVTKAPAFLKQKPLPKKDAGRSIQNWINFGHLRAQIPQGRN